MRHTLLCPQHWAQAANDHFPARRGTGYEGDDEDLILFWDQRKFRRTVQYNPRTNTPCFQSAPGTSNYRSFQAMFTACDSYHKPIEQVLHLPPDLQQQREAESEYIGDEDLLVSPLDNSDASSVSSSDDTVQVKNHPRPPKDNLVREGAMTFDPGASTHEHDHPEPEAIDDTGELLRWHYRLGHLPFSKLKALAEVGGIPKRLAKVKPPTCAGCLFGAMTKVPWRTKSPSNKEVFKVTAPGQCVSVDQLMSTQVGFVGQLKGRLTTQRYRAATVFVDHYS
jgi:hypothetical protein